jgi:hypothetical protein
MDTQQVGDSSKAYGFLSAVGGVPDPNFGMDKEIYYP